MKNQKDGVCLLVFHVLFVISCFVFWGFSYFPYFLFVFFVFSPPRFSRFPCFSLLLIFSSSSRFPMFSDFFALPDAVPWSGQHMQKQIETQEHKQARKQNEQTNTGLCLWSCFVAFLNQITHEKSKRRRVSSCVPFTVCSFMFLVLFGFVWCSYFVFWFFSPCFPRFPCSFFFS